MRRILIALTVLLAVGMTATAAMAQTMIPVTTNLEECAPKGAHFARDAVAPECTFTTNAASNTITVSCTGTNLQGVGNTNANTLLEVDASSEILCRNPGVNGKIVEPHTADITADDEDTAVPSRNGRIAISPVDVIVSEADVEEQFECPNPNWTEEVTTLTVTSIVYSVTFDGFDCPVFLAEFPSP